MSEGAEVRKFRSTAGRRGPRAYAMQTPLYRAAHGFAYWVARLWFRGLFYGYSLRGAIPRRILFIPHDDRAGNPRNGQAILGGRARILDIVNEAPRAGGTGAGRNPELIVEYHGCEWLRDLHAVGTPAARNSAGALIETWISRNRRWHPVSWRPDILSRRICNWLLYSEFVAAERDDRFASLFLDSLARQVRHLRRARPFVLHDLDRLLVLKALIYGALCLPGGVRGIPVLLRQVLGTSELQFLPDGGHVRRNPEAQFEALQLLVEIRDAVRDAELPLPDEFRDLIRRVAAMAAFFRHDDGGLALFNGASEGDPSALARLLKRAGGQGPKFLSARSAGFERVLADRNQLIVDCGPPAGGVAGTLAFEFSAARQRIVVNCGAAGRADHGWEQFLRTTAAHSTLVVEDTNSSQIRSDGTLGDGPSAVTCKRREGDGETWLDMSHDGYVRTHGLTHHRRLYMGARGTELRGEDRLTGTGDHRFDIRFHLHPLVRASVLRNGTSVLLRLPNRAGWRLLCDGGTASLEESIYLGRPGNARRSEQIVISGTTRDGDAVVRWSLAELAS